MDEDANAAWREQRGVAAAEQAAALERRKAAQTAQARQLLADFVRAAQKRGLAPTTLEARAYDGNARYRTGLTGWYLRRDGSLAVGTDGAFYILTVRGSLRARLKGVVLAPEDPPLAVGVGGRDGESMPLEKLLELRLDPGSSWT